MEISKAILCLIDMSYIITVFYILCYYYSLLQFMLIITVHVIPVAAVSAGNTCH